MKEQLNYQKKYDEYSQGDGTFVIEKVSSIQNNFFYRFVKRFFDFICSLIVLCVLCIPMLIIAIIIKFDSKGPAIYKQERVGLNGKTFTLYKFRSMRNNVEKESGAMWAEKDDPRITKVGHFLRNTRLDELPQLLNILFGQMSIVGPRPERPIFYDEFSKYITGFDQRTKVVPGLTGYAQLNGGYDLKPEEKIVYDIYYMKHRSLFWDLKLIFQTITVILSHEGAR